MATKHAQMLLLCVWVVACVSTYYRFARCQITRRSLAHVVDENQLNADISIKAEQRNMWLVKRS